MMIHKHPRTPAVLMLLAVIAFGSFLIYSRRSAPPGALDAKLAELQLAVAQPDAKPEVWLTYAQTLQAAKQLSRAVVAYEHFLESDPYERSARMACATCLAEIGNADAFRKFMEETIAVLPKAAVEIFNRPESAVYLADARFQALQKNAAAGAMD